MSRGYVLFTNVGIVAFNDRTVSVHPDLRSALNRAVELCGPLVERDRVKCREALESADPPAWMFLQFKGQSTAIINAVTE